MSIKKLTKRIKKECAISLPGSLPRSNDMLSRALSFKRCLHKFDLPTSNYQEGNSRSDNRDLQPFGPDINECGLYASKLLLAGKA
jgi:hypothetical protein